MTKREIVGLIPCAGKGSRLGAIPFSKELYPIDIVESENKQEVKVVSQYLIDQMASAGVNDFHIIIRDGKWDIPSYLDRKYSNFLNFSFHLENNGFGVPYSINKALPFAKNKICCLGFPDILVKTKTNVYKKLINKMDDVGDAVLALAVMPIDRPDKWDMVDFDESGRVKKLVIKSQSNLRYGWFCAAWGWEFSLYIQDFVGFMLNTYSSEHILSNENFFGHIINKALDEGLKVDTVRFEDGKSLDIGTFDDLKRVKKFLPG